MVGCKSRGFSFTRALLGIPAGELHLCGDPAVVPLIQEILKVTDDNIKVYIILPFMLGCFLPSERTPRIFCKEIYSHWSELLIFTFVFL